MRPLLGNLAVFQDDDLAGAADGGETVGDDDGGAAVEEALEAALDRFLGADVDVGGGLVEDEDAGLGEEGAGEGDELALAGRELDAALADFGVQALGEAGDELGGADSGDRCLDLLFGCARSAEGDVFADAAAEEEALLGNDPELAP